MNDRQRGAAYVKIVWVIVPIVLFLIAGVLAYVQTSELNKTRLELQNSKDQLKLSDSREKVYTDHLGQLSKRVGALGDFTSQMVEGAQKESRYSSPDAVKALLEDLRKSLGVSGETLADLVDPIKRTLATKSEEVKNALAQLESARSDKDTQAAAYTKSLGEKDTQINTLSSDKVEATNQLTREVANYQGQVSARNAQVTAANDNLKRAQEAAAAESTRLNREINILNARISAQAEQRKMINPPDQADGTVIGSSDSVGLAFIDIGKRHMLQPGTNFRVMEKTKSGLQQKAMARVTKVEMDRSEVQIHDVVNRLNPVVKGDVVANELYAPGAKRIVCLLGRFITPYTKEEVKRLLQELGNTVVDKVDPHVNLVVLGRDEFGEGGVAQPLAESEAFKTAVNLSIEMVPLDKVKELLRR
jgi:hypothetical protein